MKEKMDELNPFLRSLNLHVGFSGGLHCFVLRPLILTHTWSGVSDGVWITVQLPHSYPEPSSAPRFLCTFDFVRYDSSSSSPVPSGHVCVPSNCLSSHCLPSRFILLLSCSFCLPLFLFFSVGLWVCFILLFFLKVYFVSKSTTCSL